MKNSILAIGIIFLLFGVSFVSSTGNILEETLSYNEEVNKVCSCSKLMSWGDYGYAYNAYPGPEETFYFPLDDTSEYYPCGDTISGDFLYGGTVDCNGIWYASQYGNGLLYGIDTNDGCYMWSIGGGGVGINELAWDDWTFSLYGLANGQYLYYIDPETGEQENLGSIDVSLSQIEFDKNDVLYGFELLNTGNVYTINLSTLETTLVGTLTNITPSFSLGVAFDKDTDNLYLLGNGHLYICDTETYICTHIGGNMSSGIEGTSFVIPYGNNDTTPPVTTHALDPPEPDGLNGWYVSDINVTLTATDDISGVNDIYYRIDGGDWVVYSKPFTLADDGIDIIIEYYSTDKAGNIEDIISFIIDIDQTVPEIAITYEIYYDLSLGWIWEYTANSIDITSGMERVEFIINYVVQDAIYGTGPDYVWLWDYSNFSHIKGFIFKKKVTEEYVKFRTYFVIINESIDYDAIIWACGYDVAGNKNCDSLLEPPPPKSMYNVLLFRMLKLPNNYTGYVGRFLISATFNTS
jgi:hypothetical protein